MSCSDPSFRVRRVRRLAAIAIALLAGAGCQNGPDAPHARGSWTGRLEAVTTHDAAGRQYPALALRIESGPSQMRSSSNIRPAIVRTVRPGALPLLARHGLIVPPGDGLYAAGSRIRATGLMQGSQAGTILTDEDRNKHYEGVYPSGLVLYLRDDPKA